MHKFDAIIKLISTLILNKRACSFAISHSPSSAIPIFGGNLWKKKIALPRVCFQRLAYHTSLAARNLGLPLLLLATAQAADPDRIEMRIEMFGTVGVPVATNHTIVEETPERYTITTDVESRGIVSMFINVTSHSEVRGKRTNDAAHPQEYFGEVLRNGDVSRNRVKYAIDGAVTSEAIPPVKTHTPVTPPLMRGTVDQLTAFFMIERQLADRGSCALVVSVFDGRRRYNLHFTDMAPEVLQATVNRSFSGETQVCRMRREAIAGFLDDSGRTEGAYEGKLWFARLLRGDLMIPVRMEFTTEFGLVTGHLAELQGRGVHLRFTN